jgi:C4-dicarboxylate transporter DctM subunit
MIIVICILATLLLLGGFEMFLVMGIPTLITKFYYHPNLPNLVFAQKIMAGINVSTLLAIPFFIFAADIMARGAIAARLMNIIYLGLRHRRGGIAYSTVASCMAFGSVCGSAPATVAAVGRFLFPQLLKSGFTDRFSTALIASSAECALLIPPSITLIIYAWLTGTSVAALFAAGLVVGIVLGVAFMILCFWQTRRDGIPAEPRATFAERLDAWKSGAAALGLPIIVLGGIYSGVFTATEAAAISVGYAILIEGVVYRSLRLRDIVDIAESSAITTIAVFILLSMGSLLSYFITLAQVPEYLVGFLTHHEVSWIEFLLVVNILLLIAGMFIDPNSILLVMVPTLFPIASALGIDPVHFGLIVCLNICIGMITPPFGLDLFVASSTLNRPITEIVRGIGPFIVTNIIVLLIISYTPGISVFLPKMLGF